MSEADIAESGRPIRVGPGQALGVTEEMIAAVVHGFYDRIRRDDLLGPVFMREIAQDEWPRHLAKMCDFWSSILLLTGRFQGRPMAVHLRLPDISPPHFLRWLQLFQETTTEHCPPQAAALFMERANMIARSFQMGIAVARGEYAPTGAA